MLLLLASPVLAGVDDLQRSEAPVPEELGDRVPDSKPPEKVAWIEGAGGPHEGQHEAPNGGALVPLGKDAAHLEFLTDFETGLITMNVFDGRAEGRIRLRQDMIVLKIHANGEDFGTILVPQASSLTGEDKGDASVFKGGIKKLIGQERFDAVIEGITIGRQLYRRISFTYPFGTE